MRVCHAQLAAEQGMYVKRRLDRLVDEVSTNRKQAAQLALQNEVRSGW